MFVTNDLFILAIAARVLYITSWVLFVELNCSDWNKLFEEIVREGVMFGTNGPLIFAWSCPSALYYILGFVCCNEFQRLEQII